MTISLILTIHNRTQQVSKAVSDSLRLPGNEVDEAVIVLDRPTAEAEEAAQECYHRIAPAVVFAKIEGEPGWLCPAKAWNVGFQAATSDLLYLISSEVVQEAGNVGEAKELAADGHTVVFGSCHNSTPENLVVGAEPGLLVSSKMPRPLGFITCLPRHSINAVKGFDEAFMNGFWYDDDDLFLRLWRTGVDFLFSDSIHGTHLHHDRPDLSTPEGQAKIAKNHALMLQKHATTHPWPALMKLTTWESKPGAQSSLRWSHI